MEGPSADSVEKHEPASDVDTVVVDSLKALDPNRPIREATVWATRGDGRDVPEADTPSPSRGLDPAAGAEMR